MGFQFMLILGLLGMYFDAEVVFVTKSSLLFRLAVAILWVVVRAYSSVHNYSGMHQYFLAWYLPIKTILRCTTVLESTKPKPTSSLSMV